MAFRYVNDFGRSSIWLWSMAIVFFVAGLALAGFLANAILPVPSFDARVEGQCYWTSTMVVSYICGGFLGAEIVAIIRNLPVLAHLLFATAYLHPLLLLLLLLIFVLVVVAVAAVLCLLSRIRWR